MRKEIAIFCREIFDKCSINQLSPDSQVEVNVACNDVITYIISNCNESQDNDECIQALKSLFIEHFNLGVDTSYNSEEQFENCQLEFTEMTKLIEIWITKIQIDQAKNTNTPDTPVVVMKEEFDNLDFSITQFKLLDSKIRLDRRLRSSNISRPNKTMEIEEEYYSQASSSKPSLSNSDDDTNLYSESFDNDFGQSQEFLENKLNVMSSKNYELEAEISKCFVFFAFLYF